MSSTRKTEGGVGGGSVARGVGSRVKHENDGGRVTRNDGGGLPARSERRLWLFRLFPNPV